MDVWTKKKAGSYAGHAHQAAGRQWVGGDKIVRPAFIISVVFVDS